MALGMLVADRSLAQRVTANNRCGRKLPHRPESWSSGLTRLTTTTTFLRPTDHVEADGTLSDRCIFVGKPRRLEVEAVIGLHPEVSAVAVIGIPHERWGKSVHAVVVRTPDSRLDEEAVVRWCRSDWPRTRSRPRWPSSTSSRSARRGSPQARAAGALLVGAAPLSLLGIDHHDVEEAEQGGGFRMATQLAGQRPGLRDQRPSL